LGVRGTGAAAADAEGSFGYAFKEACRAARIPDKSAHGCRKIAATRAAESSATVAQLNAIFGLTGTAMANLQHLGAAAEHNAPSGLTDKYRNVSVIAGAVERKRPLLGQVTETIQLRDSRRTFFVPGFCTL
jgi:hypothetical protein